MNAPLFSKPAGPGKLPPRRINPWRMFVGSMIPNWLQSRTEINQGAKLAYARLAQYAGEDGKCFPKQKTLAAELGVSERTANEYVRTLVKSGLIETRRPGLGQPNRYFFLEHPWMGDGHPETPAASGQKRQESSAPVRQDSSGLERRETSAPIIEENQSEKNQERRTNTHTKEPHFVGLPASEDEAIQAAQILEIPAEFARQEFNRMVSVGWLDGCKRPVRSWPHYLKQRWLAARTEPAGRRAAVRTSGKRGPSPPRQFSPGDYQQTTTSF
jgi:hypothetical protein